MFPCHLDNIITSVMKKKFMSCSFLTDADDVIEMTTKRRLFSLVFCLN